MENQISKTVKGPKALFWYLSLFFTLGITAFSLGGIWYSFINNWFPKSVSYGYVYESFSQGFLKAQIAALIIAVPVFFLFSFLIRRSLTKNYLNANHPVRLWISYIILFITVAIAVGDLITMIIFLLNGEFTARFVLKALTILLIVGYIFSYYFSELQSESALAKSKLPMMMGVVAAVILAASLVGAFFLVDSPVTSRAKAYDTTRVQNLQEIRSSVESYYLINDQLPPSLETLKEDYGYTSITDPETNNNYEYRTIDGDTYELCAEFKTSNSDDEYSGYYYDTRYKPFIHEAGKKCYEISIPDDVLNQPKTPTAVPEAVQ